MTTPPGPLSPRLASSTTLILSPEGRRPLALPLSPGQVVLVTDTSGLLPNDWEQSLSILTNKTHATPSARFVKDGEIVALDKLHLVGFDIPLPDISVRDYLATFCAAPDAIIKEFELSDVAALSCAYLPPAPSRQIALLHALSHEKSIIVLNDPFLPFNGRWRESFAGFVLEQASLGGSIVVCAHVGFIPKTWTNNPTVITKDVASLIPVPAEPKEVKAPQQSHDVTGTPTPRNINDLNERYYIPGVPLPIPPGAIKVFKTTKDWIFAPLATASRFLRTWSGAVITAGLAFVLVSMGVIFVPNLPQSHALLQSLSKRFNYTWSDIFQQDTSSTKTSVETNTETRLLTTDPPVDGPSATQPTGPNANSPLEQLEPNVTDDSKTSTEQLPIITWNTVPFHLALPLNLTPIDALSPEAHGSESFLAPWHSLLRAIDIGHSNESVSPDELSPSPQQGPQETTIEKTLPFGTRISSHLSLVCPPFEECALWEADPRNLQNQQESNQVVEPVTNVTTDTPPHPTQ